MNTYLNNLQDAHSHNVLKKTSLFTGLCYAVYVVFYYVDVLPWWNDKIDFFPLHFITFGCTSCYCIVKKNYIWKKKKINKVVLIRFTVLHPFGHSNIHTCLTLDSRLMRDICLPVCAILYVHTCSHSLVVAINWLFAWLNKYSQNSKNEGEFRT